MNEFFDELGTLFVNAAKKRGATIEKPMLDPKISDALLELAKVVSHTRERMFAPLACYIAGLAAEDASKQTKIDIADFVKEVRVALETKT